MSKFTLVMIRDKEANGATYRLPEHLVSKKLDPVLYASLSGMKEYSSVEEAEAEANKIAKQIFIYDHTKRPHVMKDFRLYRFWIIDLQLPVSTMWKHESYDVDTIEHFLATNKNYSISWVNGIKDAIVKKVKIDFSKEADPSSGAIVDRAKANREKWNKEIKEYWANPKNHLKAFFDDKFNYTYIGPQHPKYAIDLIPLSGIHTKNFHKDSLNLPTEFCFVYPTKGCYYSDTGASVVGADPNSRKKVWACAVSRCTFDDGEELYKSTIKVFPTKEEAIFHANLLGFPEPKIFDTFDRPDYVNRLLGYIEGIGGRYTYPVEIYRVMVLDGYMKPIEKFVKKDKDMNTSVPYSKMLYA